MRSRLGWFLLALALTPGCVGLLDDAPSGPRGSPRPVDPGSLPAPAMRRLTADQYRHSVADLLGEGVAPTGALEPDAVLNGFVSLGAARATISPLGAELYEQAALDVAHQAVSDPARRDALVPCTPSSPTDATCARAFVTDFGRRAWRRPLEADEIETYAAIVTRAGEVLGDFDQGIELGIAALLQSPHFLFRVELGEPAPGGGRRYTSLEMASRLSYALWSSTPDDALLDAGERGDLATEEGVRREAARMLASPRGRAAVRDFFTQLLRLYQLDHVSQDPAIFPQVTDTIGPAMRESTLLTLESQLLEEGASYRSIFDSRRTFVDRELAALYGVPAPEAGGFAEVELPSDGPRAGLLGQASLLTLLSHPDGSSPTVRGKFVREALLCQSIPPPPPDVGELPEPSPDLPTMRERLAEHRTNPACASCHAITDPIGLGLENFDGIGAFRETENGATIDPSGELDGVVFADARGLGEALRDHPELTHCLVRNLYRFATGHVESGAEVAMLEALAAEFDEAALTTLLVEIVASEEFRHTGAVE